MSERMFSSIRLTPRVIPSRETGFPGPYSLSRTVTVKDVLSSVYSFAISAELSSQSSQMENLEKSDELFAKLCAELHTFKIAE